MKLRTKIALFILFSPGLIFFFATLWLFSKSTIPAVQKADINIIDVVKSGGLSDKQTMDIRDYAIEESNKLGKEAGKAFVDAIKSVFVPMVEIDTTKMPDYEYPYSIDDALDEVNKATEAGIKDGLDHAAEIIENNDKIRKEILNSTDN
jgi:hypothetical protein